MGLYDNYKVNLSNTVRPFAGSVVPELREMKKDMDTASYKTLDLNMSTQDLLATAPTLDMDKDAYNQVSSEALGKIDAISQSGELARSLPDALAVAHQTARKLKSLVSRKESMEEYKGKLTTMTPDVQEYLIAETERQNGPAQFDSRTQRANPIVPVMPAKQIKDDEMVRQAVISIVRSKGYSVSDSDMNSMTQNKETGSYTIKTSNGIQEIPAKDLMKTVDDALANSKEWQASLEQDAKAESYGLFKNISEEQAQQEIDNPTLGYGKRAQEIFLKGGVTAKQALEMAGSEKIKMDKISNLKTYASGAASRELTESTMTGTVQKDGGAGGAGGNEKNEPDENAALRTSLTSQSNVGAASSTLLQTNIKDYEAKEGTVLAKMKENDRIYSGALKVNNVDVMQNAVAEKTILDEELAQIRSDKSKTQERFNRVLTRKTAEMYPGHSWSTIRNASNAEVAKVLKTDPAFSKLTDKELQAIANTEYTLQTIAVGGAMGTPVKTIRLNYPSVNGPASIVIRDNTADQITTANKFKDRILEAAQNDTKLIDQVQTTGISFNAGASKALEGIVGSSALYDASNTTNKTKDLIGNIDPTKISIGQLHPEIDRVSVNIDGTTYLMDISNARTKKYMAERLLDQPEKDMRTIGRDLLLDVNQKASTKYEDAFSKGSGVVYKHPLDIKSDIRIGGQEYGIKRVSNSKTGTESYVFINPKRKTEKDGGVTAIPLGNGTTKTTFTFPEIKTILNNLVQPVQ